MDDAAIARAKQAMESMLANLDVALIDESIPLWESRYQAALLQKNDPRIVDKGDTALVLELGNFGTSNERADFVGKIVNYVENTQYPGRYVLRGFDVSGLQKTVDSLTEMGFEVPLFQEFTTPGKDRNIRPYFYHISPDFREGGRYTIHDADASVYSALLNGVEVQSQLDSYVETITKSVKSGRYYISVDNHGTNDTPQKALQHMFFVRVNPLTHVGSIVIGDLDHVVIGCNEINL